MDVSVIIRALRCISGTGSHCMGKTCPYYTEERLPPDLAEKAGTDTWGGCDCDRVGFDAADALKKIKE